MMIYGMILALMMEVASFFAIASWLYTVHQKDACSLSGAHSG